MRRSQYLNIQLITQQCFVTPPLCLTEVQSSWMHNRPFGILLNAPGLLSLCCEVLFYKQKETHNDLIQAKHLKSFWTNCHHDLASCSANPNPNWSVLTPLKKTWKKLMKGHKEGIFHSGLTDCNKGAEYKLRNLWTYHLTCRQTADPGEQWHMGHMTSSPSHHRDLTQTHISYGMYGTFHCHQITIWATPPPLSHSCCQRLVQLPRRCNIVFKYIPSPLECVCPLSFESDHTGCAAAPHQSDKTKLCDWFIIVGTFLIPTCLSCWVYELLLMQTKHRYNQKPAYFSSSICCRKGRQRTTECRYCSPFIYYQLIQLASCQPQLLLTSFLHLMLCSNP